MRALQRFTFLEFGGHCFRYKLFGERGMSFREQPRLRLILTSFFAIFLFLILPFAPCIASANTPEPSEAKIFLHEGWALQSSCLFLARGEQISAPGYKTNGWHSATVPTTVVAALVAAKTYPEPH